MHKTTKEAIQFIIDTKGFTKYRIAMQLGASAVSVSQWLNNTRMSTPYARIIYKLYNITITDAV